MSIPARGGPQFIPRPDGVRPGDVAPWAPLPLAERIVTVDRLRDVFSGRRGAPSVQESVPGARGSSVLAPFYVDAGVLHVVLTRRSQHLRAHKGEVSFPGGAAEPGETFVETALREAKEEIALDPSSVDILGELDHLTTYTSGRYIVPLVGLLDGVPDLAPNDEVEAVLRVPVSELVLDEVYREEIWPFRVAPPWLPEELREEGPIERPLFFFELVGDTIWGATAAMLRQLVAMAIGIPIGIDHR